MPRPLSGDRLVTVRQHRDHQHETLHALCQQDGFIRLERLQDRDDLFFDQRLGLDALLRFGKVDIST